MSDSDIVELLDALDGQIATLEQLLKPLTSKDVAATVQKLPILDQSKLHVLTAYAANSLIFSALKLNGQDPRSHPVFTEIARTKQYFEKIKTAEEKASDKEEPRARLDVAAAGRFVKAGLAGNERHDRERVERETVQREGAKRKLEALEGRDAGQQDEAQAADWETKQSKRNKRSRNGAGRARRGGDNKSADTAQEAAEAAPEAGDAGGGDEAQEATPRTSEKQQNAEASGAHSSGSRRDKKERKKFEKSSKAPRGASEVMQDLLKKGSDRKQKKEG